LVWFLAAAEASSAPRADDPPSARTPGGGVSDPRGAVDVRAADAGGLEPGDADAPPNRACLDGLRANQVAFIEWPTRGVRTPVRILGPLGAVILRSHDPRATSKAVLMDCELARALIDAAPAFRALGVRELQYSGAYQYRTRRRSTRLSEHAHGLAIDVHAFVIDDGPAADGPAGAPALADGARRAVIAEVTRDFEAGVGKWAVTAQDECVGRPRAPLARTLRTLACRLRASSIFREVITPDDNSDHHDHFHLEAFPDALSRTRAILARKPSVIDD